jgi:hypothetical protein
MREPFFRIKVDEERHALALAQELLEIAAVHVHRNSEKWEVSVDCERSDGVVVRVLDALRRTLAREPTAEALVLLEGREYNMRGE